MSGLLSRERIVAPPGFNRWLVPPAALAIHLCIGQAYAFSVFKLPLTKLIGGGAPAPGDWTQEQIAWVFTIAIFFLGLSAALFGRWLENAGPRASGVASACCWAGGFFLSAVAVRTHQLWLLYLGYGVLGGCGLGLGYITPVSTLIKWFPDRRGLATGMAIMGFGGGAMVASALSQLLMERFRGPGTPGVAETFLALGAIFGVVMLAGAFSFRLPPPGWRPGHTPAAVAAADYVPLDRAWRTPQFALLWAVLFLNVTAGIGILEQASPMIQELFVGGVDARAAAGFVGLLSLFNMAGRFLWSSVSDRLGRRTTYTVFFVLGAALYALLPSAGRLPGPGLFVLGAVLVLTLYGGGFATIPAYLSDLFGTQNVGAIHGRLLTAWSCAGIAGPVIVNSLRAWQLGMGVPARSAYDLSLYLMAGLLCVGLACNLAVRPVR
ncbi:MAG: yhjX 2, partial [Armatimonadetes bacterium]|nr:yhjX 2 [Armatimonadota bacterium]